jgi:hypothetical protein
MLELSGADRLFEICETNAQAVKSFRQHPPRAPLDTVLRRDSLEAPVPSA